MCELVEKINNAGRKKGSGNVSNYKWEVIMFDKTNNSFREGKFTSINQLNDSWGLNLNSDYVKRIMTKYRVDATGRNKENSFIARWGHIKINKICEKVTCC